MKVLVSFTAGLCAGAVLLYFVLWWNGQVGEAARPRAPLAQATPAPTAPTAPTLGSVPPALSPAEGVPPPPPAAVAPETLPGAETPSTLNPFAPPPPFKPLEIDAPPPRSSPPPDLTDYQRLQARSLLIPVEGVAPRSLKDTFAEMRGSRVHEAIDISAPRGRAVLAVDDGVVRKLFTSAHGGLTVYQFDGDEAYCYYYAHLDRYAEGLAEGMSLKKGDHVGYVGTTGNAPPGTPHLHFTIFRLGPEKRWWEGTPINPYPLWVFDQVAAKPGVRR